MLIPSLVLLLAGIVAISNSAPPATSLRFPTFNGKYIIVLREFQNYTGGPLPSTYNNSKARVENFLKQYSSVFARERYNIDRPWKIILQTNIYPRSLLAKYLNWYYPVVGQYSPLYIGFVAELNARALTRVRTLPQVYFIEKDQTYNISAEWHLDRIDQRNLPLDGEPYNSQYTGAGVDIYILDTGIRYSHSEFGGRAIYGGFDFQPSSAPDGPGSDCSGHGTHVAALAGGSTVGVAREATLYSIRMIGCDGRTSTSTILRALEHVVEHKNPLKTVIMSMSFGVPVSASINLCVSIAHWNGIIPVASAGNNEFDSCRKSPASATHAFTVGATDRYDKTWHKTNYGRCVNIFAPGADIRSASDDSDYGYTVYSGTSMAAPLVSGAAAVILDRYPNFKPKQVMSRLINRSTKNKVNFVSFPFWATLLTPNRLLFVE